MPPDVTRLLDAARAGDNQATADLLAALQGELRQLAARHLAGERVGHTLQPTALVNEAFVKLVGRSDADNETEWASRQQFLAYASTAMRRVLLEHARARLAVKRGDGAQRVTLFEVPSALDDEPEATVALDDALAAFAELDPRGARIVELRWFGGISNAEVAATLDVSERTVERSWRAARAWLRQRIGE